MDNQPENAVVTLVTFHDNTKYNALTTDFELRSLLPTTAFEVLLLQI